MEAWDEFLAKLEPELGVETVKKWLKPLKVLKFDARNLYLEAKDSFQALWFEEHIRKRALNGLFNNNHQKIKVHLTIFGKSSPSQLPPVRGSGKEKKESALPPFQIIFDPIDPLCILSNFLENENSKIVVKLLKEKEIAFNPIYLFGPTGSGKTHLLMSFADQMRKNGKEVIYIKADTFTDHVVSAIRSSEMSYFREKYRNADILLIDDVHLFSRKSATQEELFHTFNALHLNEKKIILTANCPPKDLQEIEPRLVSRFEWGIVLELTSLVEDNLTLLLKKKAEALKFQLPDKVIDFLVSSFSSSSKSAVRALEALILRSHIQKGNQVIYRPMSVELAEQYLSDLLLAEKQQLVTPEKVIHACSLHFSVKAEDILGKSKNRNYAEPRQLAMYICRKNLKLPFTRIGELFGRDHSTVMSSVRLLEQQKERSDPPFMSNLQAIEKLLNK